MSEKQENKKETSKKQDVKKAGFGGLAGGAALAGAGALVYDKTTGQEFAQFETADGHVVGIWTDTDNNGIYDTEFIRATPIPEGEQNEEGSQADSPPQNEEGQTFNEAFAEARSELGAGSVFEWHGEQYNTFYAQELADMSDEQINSWASLPVDERSEYYNSIDPEFEDGNEINEQDDLIAQIEEELEDEVDNDDDVSEWGMD